MDVPYSIPKVIDRYDLDAVISHLYGYDAHLYSKLKNQEGQYAYFDYVERMRRAVRDTFYSSSSSQKRLISQINSRNITRRSSSTCLILNNTSLLGHVTVLRSIAKHLLQNCTNGQLFVANLWEGTPKKDLLWKRTLESAGFKVFPLSRTSLTSRFLEIDNSLNPRQYLWWGWPPGQWIGPLFSPHAIHRSVSFKYDFPVAEFFDSHHIGYGDIYASMISDSCKIYGFTQQFSVNLIPTFSEEKAHCSTLSLQSKYKSCSLGTRDQVHIGSLGRSEKFAQPTFLECIREILNKDSRIIFHWTGREHRSDIDEFFTRHKLANRIRFHGWVKPFDYLQTLDLYVDTFPFGTGETLVLAGMMGLPLVTLNSPYEANFTNLMLQHEEANKTFISTHPSEYINKVLALITDQSFQDPASNQKVFREIFDASFSPRPAMLVSKFSRDLDL